MIDSVFDSYIAGFAIGACIGLAAALGWSYRKGRKGKDD